MQTLPRISLRQLCDEPSVRRHQRAPQGRRRAGAARGTIHNWVNKGTAPCVIAFVLVAAKPVTAGGKVLNAVG